MQTDGKNKKIVITAEDELFINDLITNNVYIIKSQMRRVFGRHYDRFAEDCISEIYLLLCEKVAAVKNHENPVGWLSMTSKYVARNLMRREMLRGGCPAPENHAETPTAVDVFEEAVYNIWVEQNAVDKILDVLPPRELEIYGLLYKEKLKPKEVAEQLGISVNTVWVINSSIRNKVEKAIKEKLF